MRTIFASFAMMFVVLACATFTLTACGDDNNPTTPPGGGGGEEQHELVGTWKGPIPTTNDYFTICFKADYTGWDTWGDEMESFTWYTDDDILVIFYPEEAGGYDQDEYTYKVIGNKLYLYDYNDPSGAHTPLYTLTRQ
ncbi:MAG: hypothetical protein ACI3YC_05165 [Alloprevotella sp.]